MNQSILVSVIVPVYQVEDYVGRCIESIQKQTYKNIEILLIDDGSKDKSGAICDSYAESDSRIQVYHKENGGLSDARNYGIDRAVGGYLSFIDSDDYVTEDFIETLLNCCQKNRADIAVCGFQKVSENEIKPSKDVVQRIVTREEVFRQICINNQDHVLYTVAWNKLYKKSLFDFIRYPVGKLHEDEATTYKLFAESKKIVVTNKEMYGYYMSPKSIMRSSFNIRRLDILDIQRDRIRFFHNRNMDDFEVNARIQFGETIIYNYYNIRKFLSESKTLQKKLTTLFKEECFQHKKRYPLFVRIHFTIFYYWTDVYYMFFSIYQKMK